MDIIVFDNGNGDADIVEFSVKQWGFSAVSTQDESTILPLAKKTPSLRVIFLDASIPQLRHLVDDIRDLKQYIYIFCIIPAKIDPDAFISETGVEEVLVRPFDLNYLRFRLHGIKQVINYSFDYRLYNQLQTRENTRQTLNLKARAVINDERDAFRKQVVQLIERLKSIRVSQQSINQGKFDDLLPLTEKVGSEELTDWLSGLLFMKTNPAMFKLFNDKLLQHQLNEIRSKLEDGLQCLSDFGFFDRADGSETSILENRRVLLVEDMKYNRVLLKKILQKQKCEIVEAVNGQDAVENWERHQDFDLIIMDMNMPVMDGFAATKKIRDLEKEKSLERTPIIALTALAMRGDKELCLEAGTDDYLPKPVEAHSLIKTCQRLLQGEETQSPAKQEQFHELAVKRVLVKTRDDIIEFALDSFLKKQHIEHTFFFDSKKVLNVIVEEEFDLMILEADIDLELAFFIKTNFPNQHITLVMPRKPDKGLLAKNVGNNLMYPFKSDQILQVFRYFSDKLNLAKKEAEKLADVDSLGKIKGQIGIDEAVQKSDNQLAVWQKAFRKIGGDLVLSHQFNFHGKYGLILGDVAGHDIQSGYTASWFSGLVEGIWDHNSSPFRLLLNLNNLFAHDADEESKRFVCALVLLWDPLRKKLSYANAGIPGGILIKKETGKAEAMEWTGVPIGLFPDMDMYDNGEIDFEEGDRLIMATDGVLEAIPREIISGLGVSKSNHSAQQTLEAIVDFVTRSIEIVDDLTIAVFEAKTPTPPENGFRQSIQSDFKDVDAIVLRMETFLNEKAPDRFNWPMISIAVREALINAVEHGNKNQVELPVDVDFEVTDDALVVTISDCGSGFDLSRAKKRLEKEGDLRIHGRGIEMMENIGKSVEYQGGGIRLEFEAKT